MNPSCAGVLAVALLLCFSACLPSSPTPENTAPAGDQAAHDHDHEADAAPAHEELGPHGGHLLALGGEYQAEWLHDDASGLLTVYLLANDTQAQKPASVTTVNLEVTLGGNTRRYELQPVNRDESAAAAGAEYSITDRPLGEALKAVGHGVDAVLIAEIDGQPQRGPFEHLAHDDGHGHEH